MKCMYFKNKIKAKGKTFLYELLSNKNIRQDFNENKQYTI